MAATKTKKSKSNSRLKRLIHSFDPTSKKGMLALFLVSFVVVGGGYAAYKTFAATYPPDKFTDFVSIDQQIKASDGVSGPVQCRSVAAKTGYGSLANCMQFKDSQGRTGLYSLDLRTFSPSGSWQKIAELKNTWAHVPKCKNMDNYFGGSINAYSTAYGPTLYGQIYRLFSYKDGTKITSVWQVKWANLNLINGNCYPSGSWYNALSWDNIQTN